MHPNIEAKAKVFKALGHPSRLAIVEALCDGELCVCDIVPVVGRDISTVSKHLSLLKEAGILQHSKRGTNVYYRLAMDCVPGFLSCLENFLGKRFEEQARAYASNSIKKM
ncbi:ArsR/SmtB family transcription factor [Maridesulfovibrio hydrothermalis]|uniref:Transcriptional regulator, ArsR family n=1 Tax=Maridesulfovibrio hydrothermalis AM13 = DSM 14728 TaxID=1121451 RepID=L0R9M2_9BACT|nr:metalloregulator ArsR/SmtB family transcription factor [Maridesulfovibrio hydrothermalis]CCO23468.1 Transcriptional regulator, ArsR family [Maridesulfovibrio hydrothermalis AM13 = DSM 14728]